MNYHYIIFAIMHLQPSLNYFEKDNTLETVLEFKKKSKCCKKFKKGKICKKCPINHA